MSLPENPYKSPTAAMHESGERNEPSPRWLYVTPALGILAGFFFFLLHTGDLDLSAIAGGIGGLVGLIGCLLIRLARWVSE